MGLFSAIMSIFSFRDTRELKKSVDRAKEKERRYIASTQAELSILSDDELYEAVLVRTEHKLDSFDRWEDGVNSLNRSQKIFYSINWFETEVNNGGLCQFFVNASRMIAPVISEYMGIIGANDHKKLYDDFVNNNEIDLTDLSFFDVHTVEDFKEKTQKYPFYEFDNAFYDMEELAIPLTEFARQNLADF